MSVSFLQWIVSALPEAVGTPHRNIVIDGLNNFAKSATVAQVTPIAMSLQGAGVGQGAYVFDTGLTTLLDWRIDIVLDGGNREVLSLSACGQETLANGKYGGVQIAGISGLHVSVVNGVATVPDTYNLTGYTLRIKAIGL